MFRKKCELFEKSLDRNEPSGCITERVRLKSRCFSEDVWGQFSLQGANLCHAELDGLDPRKVDTSGIKNCSPAARTDSRSTGYCCLS
nr:hypothetical protein [Escherichia coli]